MPDTVVDSCVVAKWVLVEMDSPQADRILSDAAELARALEIAARYDRSIYDAAFLALAQHLGLKGVTTDEPLYKAVHADFSQIILLRDW